MKMSKSVEQALRDVNAVLLRRNKHFVYGLPNGRIVVVPMSPSDWRGEKNLIQQISRSAKMSGRDECHA
jgi:predicted RNA binding protein YcfA (HicA-like mRNA interferase family)